MVRCECSDGDIAALEPVIVKSNRTGNMTLSIEPPICGRAEDNGCIFNWNYEIRATEESSQIDKEIFSADAKGNFTI